jgi:DNA-binding winged helix-turn-helix (wHTH) protein/TolB-like protein
MIYKFGVFEFDAASGELRKNGRVVAIEPQPAKALALLLARAADRGGVRADGIVSREELRDAVWGADTHVDFDRGLAYCLSQVRAALADSGDNPRFVQTIPRRGFKFIAPVSGRAEAAVRPAETRRPPAWKLGVAMAGFVLVATFAFWRVFSGDPSAPEPVVIAVSVFDNETGQAEYDRPVAGLSDLVVERLTKLDPDQVAIVGNAAELRQPRNIRNLKALTQAIRADYVLLGQLQRGETGLRFITHFIRVRDEAHLKANRLQVADEKLAGLEAAVADEFENAVRQHILMRPANQLLGQ